MKHFELAQANCNKISCEATTTLERANSLSQHVLRAELEEIFLKKSVPVAGCASVRCEIGLRIGWRDKRQVDA